MFRLSIVETPNGEPPAGAETDFNFDRDVVYLGRRDGVDIQLPASPVSAVHARVERAGDAFTVTDQGANGTRLNGIRLAPRRPTPLTAGDNIQLGGFVLRFHGASAPGTPQPETPPATTRSIARRMVGEVLAALGNPRSPTLRIVSGPRSGTQLAVTVDRPIELGRDDSCDLAFPDPDASRKNSRILRSGEHTLIVDLNSKNGTLVNDHPIAVSHTLRHNDRLLIGATTVIYEDPTENYLSTLAADSDPDPSDVPVPVPGHASPPETAKAADSPPPRPYLILAIASAAAILALVTLVILFR